MTERRRLRGSTTGAVSVAVRIGGAAHAPGGSSTGPAGVGSLPCRVVGGGAVRQSATSSTFGGGADTDGVAADSGPRGGPLRQSPAPDGAVGGAACTCDDGGGAGGRGAGGGPPLSDCEADGLRVGGAFCQEFVSVAGGNGVSTVSPCNSGTVPPTCSDLRTGGGGGVAVACSALSSGTMSATEPLPAAPRTRTGGGGGPSTFTSKMLLH